MITNRSFETKEIDYGSVEAEAIRIDVRADERIMPGQVVIAIDGKVDRLHWSDAGRLASVLQEMANAAKYLENH